jgi:hypothetical protein
MKAEYPTVAIFWYQRAIPKECGQLPYVGTRNP